VSKLILFNKPYQVLSQFSDLDQKVTLKKYLNHSELEHCYPAGRLDYDSEGLLLLTDDGKLQNQIADPQHKLPKYYWAQVEGKPTNNELAALRKGVLLKDGPCKPAKVDIIQAPSLWDRNPSIRKRNNDQTTWLSISITEGRNRQIRRMCGAINSPCLRLVRYRIGIWSLEGIKPGEYQLHNVHLPALEKQRSEKYSSETRKADKRRASNYKAKSKKANKGGNQRKNQEKSHKPNQRGSSMS